MIFLDSGMSHRVIDLRYHFILPECKINWSSYMNTSFSNISHSWSSTVMPFLSEYRWQRVSLESGILTPGRCAGFDAHILCKALAGICDRGIVVYCLVCVRLCLRVCRNQRRLSGALRRPNTDTRYSVILLIGSIAQKKKYLRHRLWPQACFPPIKSWG